MYGVNQPGRRFSGLSTLATTEERVSVLCCGVLEFDMLKKLLIDLISIDSLLEKKVWPQQRSRMHCLWARRVTRPSQSKFKFWSKDQLTREKDRIPIKDLYSNKWKYKTKEARLIYSREYSWLPITRTLANSNQNRFPLDVRHTITVILPSVTRTLDNSKLPLTRSNFCFPSDHFYIILPSITRTMFWALKKSGKNSVLPPKHWILNFPLTCCRHIVY